MVVLAMVMVVVVLVLVLVLVLVMVERMVVGLGRKLQLLVGPCLRTAAKLKPGNL